MSAGASEPAVGDARPQSKERRPDPGFWRGRSVVVTGGSGLLGSWLARALARLEAEVTCVTRHGGRFLETIVGAEDAVQVRLADVGDAEEIAKILDESGADTVFHLAAQTHGGVAREDPMGTFETNIKGTWTVLDAVRCSKLRPNVVAASTYNVYGDEAVAPYTEDMPLRARQPYDVSKACGDLLGTAYALSYGLPVVVARFGRLFGGGDPDWRNIVPGTIRTFYEGECPVIRSHGRLVRDFLYVEDVVDAHLLLAETLSADSSVSGEAFNISTDEPVSLLELVERIRRIMGSDREPIVEGEPVDEPLERYVSPAKAFRVLGWRPRFGLDRGLSQTIGWYVGLLSSTKGSDRVLS